MKDTVPVEILHLEDDVNDVELIQRWLHKEGISCAITVVKKKEEFEAALQSGGFDAILSDFSIPGYDGSTALRSARQARPDVPFLFVSGTIGEDRAVEALQCGATDYILKERLHKLAAALRRALSESSERALRKKAEADRRELEEQLRQAQKLEAVGQMAGGVAHDFNNLLLVIQGYAEMLILTEPRLTEGVRQSFKQVLATCQRASNLTRQLLTFGRKQPINPKLLDLSSVAEELLTMLRRVVPSSIGLDSDCEKGLPPVYADRGMIEQVLMNLVINARDATPDGGQIQVSVRKERIGPDTQLKHADARQGECLCLEVRDTGSGIASGDLPRIFEPFFTTKKPGMGTGLGLATVYGIVKQHEGWVDVASEVGKGTRFVVYLPVQGLRTSGRNTGQSVCESAAGRILIVEDDEIVRRFTVQTLRTLGFNVMEAQSGKAARERWAQSGGAVDVLVADIFLPDGTTGTELAYEFRKTESRLQVILTSGYPREALRSDAPVFANASFLQKPYSVQQLEAAVKLASMNKAIEVMRRPSSCD